VGCHAHPRVSMLSIDCIHMSTRAWTWHPTGKLRPARQHAARLCGLFWRHRQIIAINAKSNRQKELWRKSRNTAIALTRSPTTHSSFFTPTPFFHIQQKKSRLLAGPLLPIMKGSVTRHPRWRFGSMKSLECQPALPFELTDTDGQTHRLEQYAGRPLLLVFHRHLG